MKTPVDFPCSHSDKKPQVRGVCCNCYRKWLVRNNPEFKAKLRSAHKEWYKQNRAKNNPKDPKWKAQPTADLKDIPGYEGFYAVSKSGDVWSHRRGYYLKPFKNSTGRLNIELSIDKKAKTLLVHRLVAMAHLNNKDNLPVVNHKDGDPLNNHVSNLEWCTSGDNQRHAYRTGLKRRPLGERSNFAKYDESTMKKAKALLKEKTPKEVSMILNVSYPAISALHNGKSWRHI